MDHVSVIKNKAQSEHNAMQSAGIELINKIIEAEQNARKLAEEAYEKRDTMRSELGTSTEDLRREYFARANTRIQKVREQNKVIAGEQIAVLDETFTRDLERIETAFTQNQDEWTEKLFDLIIGRN